MLKNQALRGDMMRGHAQTIEAEIRRMVADWGDEGEIDLLDFFAELTIYTTSSCLIGKPFREELDASFAAAPTTSWSTAPTRSRTSTRTPTSRASAHARRRAGDSWSRWSRRSSTGRKARGTVAKEDRDLLDVLISIDMAADDITGIFISMMFAGHHTVVGHGVLGDDRAAPPPRRHVRRRRRARRALRRRRREVSFQALRSIPVLESALKETLRLHPPLIILMRLVQEDFELLGHTIPAGTVHRRLAAGVEPDRGGLPEGRRVRPGSLHRPAPGGPAEPLDVDPVRRRQAPLRRQRVRDDADEGDLLGDPARLRVRGRAAARLLPRRLLQDGDPARAAVPGPLPAAVERP